MIAQLDHRTSRPRLLIPGVQLLHVFSSLFISSCCDAIVSYGIKHFCRLIDRYWSLGLSKLEITGCQLADSACDISRLYRRGSAVKRWWKDELHKLEGGIYKFADGCNLFGFTHKEIDLTTVSTVLLIGSFFKAVPAGGQHHLPRMGAQRQASLPHWRFQQVGKHDTFGFWGRGAFVRQDALFRTTWPIPCA